MFPNEAYLKKFISDKSNEKTLFYIAVGSASNIEEKAETKLESKNMHQCPPFIEKFKNETDHKLVLILIDELLMDKPYVVSYFSDKYGYEFIKDDKNYFERDGKINIINLQFNISYEDEKIGQNIIPFLNTLNDLIIENKNSFLFYHDYSGFDTSNLAFMYDDELKDYVNRIIYDISYRSNEGCVPNLNSINYYFNGEYFVTPYCSEEILKEYLDIYESKQFAYHRKEQILNFFDIILPIYRGLIVNKFNGESYKKFFRRFYHLNPFLKRRFSINLKTDSINDILEKSYNLIAYSLEFLYIGDFLIDQKVDILTANLSDPEKIYKFKSEIIEIINLIESHKKIDF